MLAMAAPAAAGVDCGNPKFADKPQCLTEPPSGDEPVLVDVTMTLVNGQGITTDCNDGDGIFGDDGDGIDGSTEMYLVPGSLISNPGGGRGYRLEPVRDPVLGVWMNDVNWFRIYEDPEYGASGTEFAGCHRMLLDPAEPEAMFGALFIDVDDSGAIAGILWHFDYWYMWGERGSKKNPTPYVMEFEQFTLKMHPEVVDNAGELIYEWADHTPGVAGDINGRLTAQFWLSYHLQGDGYQPIGKQTMSFDVVAVPRTG
jgi:hypothetical protein